MGRTAELRWPARTVGRAYWNGRAGVEAAYNDSAGVTAEFNRNVLTHINEELGANFDASRFDHAAEYDDHTGCVKMFLVSRVDQSVSVGGRIIRFAAGERIHTENSYKYHPDEFLAIATRAGFACQHFWTDVHDRFALFLLGAASVVA